MKIPFCRPRLEPYADAVAAVVRENCAGPGKHVAALESFLTERYGTPVVCASSGTLALWASLRATPAPKHTNIAVPAYGAIQTANAAALSGECSLWPVDVNWQGCMDLEALARFHALQRLSHVVYVDFCGRVCQNLLDVARWCDEHGITLIEDAACGVLNRFHGQWAGSFGDFGVLSFSGPKHITGGQGGAVVCPDEAGAAKVRGFLNHGYDYDRATCSERSLFPGLQGRMTDLSAALILAQFENEDGIRTRLDTISEHYKSLPVLEVPSGPPFHHITLTDAPDTLLRGLRDVGIEARRNYRPLRNHVAFWGMSAEMGAQTWWDHAVYLPFGPGLTAEEVDYVTEHVRLMAMPYSFAVN